MGADIGVELGNTATSMISIGATAPRTLAGVPSGAIRVAADFYGKSSLFSFTISANQQEANLRTLALAAGWNGSSAVRATINAGVYIWSNNTGTAALTINGSWPGGVTLVNNGFIMGRGGNGGTGYWSPPSSAAMAGSTGGPAISLGVNATITNNAGAFIAGGGGGGAGSGITGATGGAGGGGAGGGTGGNLVNAGGGSNNTAGGAGGAIGSSGSNGALPPNSIGGSGGGGGRILAGTGGAGGTSGSATGKGGGSGGGGAYGVVYKVASGSGGAGGTAGAAGSAGTGGEGGNGGGGGGWGASGGAGSTGGASVGAGGRAIALNGFTATRSGAGTTYGAVS
jgi:hypothetical protein